MSGTCGRLYGSSVAPSGARVEVLGGRRLAPERPPPPPPPPQAASSIDAVAPTATSEAALVLLIDSSDLLSPGRPDRPTRALMRTPVHGTVPCHGHDAPIQGTVGTVTRQAHAADRIVTKG